MNKRVIVLILLYFTLFLIACQKIAPPYNPDGNDTSNTGQTSLSSRALITPDGGSVGIEGLIALNIPSGALSENTTVTLVKLDKDTLWNDFLYSSDVFRIEPESLVFNIPATLVIRYRDAQRPKSLNIYKNSRATTLYKSKGTKDMRDWAVVPTSISEGLGFAMAMVDSAMKYALADTLSRRTELPYTDTRLMVSLDIRRIVKNRCFYEPSYGESCDTMYEKSDFLSISFTKDTVYRTGDTVRCPYFVAVRDTVMSKGVFMGWVYLDDYPFVWDSTCHYYWFPVEGNFTIEPGKSFTIEVEGSSGYRGFRHTAVFPRYEPRLANHIYGDSISLSSGSMVNWYGADAFSPSVYLEVIDTLPNLGNEHIVPLSVRTYNSGSYFLTPAALSGISNGEHILTLTLEERFNIGYLPGYHDKSRILLAHVSLCSVRFYGR